jgi:mono/diheme cytochrome c family protein
MTGARNLIAIVLTLALSAVSLAAQSSADSVTTSAGVYTGQQARRGSDVYAGNCRSCHTVESHTGAAFSATWNHRPLYALFQYMTERMPKNDPGSLAPQEYADVLAYVLKMNGLPAGTVALPADSATLKIIRIELPQPQTRAQP